MLSDLRRLAADWPADQLVVIALCVLALLFAAVAAPQPAPSDAREPTGPGETPTPTAPSPGEAGETAAPSEGSDGGDTRPVEDGDPDGELMAPTCSIVVPARVVPGDRMAVVVRSPRGPVAGAEVFVNDRSIGVTDDSGTVSTRVPYERRLTVAADLPDDAACQAPETVTVENAGMGLLAAETAAGTASPENETDRIERTVTVRGTLTVSVTGDPYPGSVVTVRAAIGARPVPNATVTLDGDRTGRTDSSGRARVRLPESGETVTVRVERGEFAGARAIDLAHLRASLSSTGLFATPGDPATIRVTAGDDPVPNATVELDGGAVVRADTEGTAAVTLPHDPFATYRVSGADQTTRVAVWPTYLSTALLGVIPVLTVIGLLAVVGLAVAWGRSGAPSPISTVETPSTPDLAPVEHPDLTREQLRERYRAFARRIAPREWATTPPGAIARRAIAAGEPADAVATLTALFREIEYGDRPLDADRAERAAEALDRLEEP